MKKEKDEKILHIEELRKRVVSEKGVKGGKENKKKKNTVKITFFLLIVAILVLMLTPVFTAQWFEVTGNTTVSDEQILQACGIKTGDNLFRINIKKTKDKIRTINHIDEVKVLRLLPNGVKITVTERTAVVSLKSATGYLNVDREGKIMELVKETSLPVMENIDTGTLKLGDFLEDVRITQIEELDDIAGMLNEFGLVDRLTEVGIDKAGNYKIVIDGNKNVVLGDNTRIDYKLKMLKSVIDELSPTEEGTIDLSTEGQALYSP